MCYFAAKNERERERLRVSRSSDFTRIKPPIFAKNHTKRIMRQENSEEKFYCLSLSAMADLLSNRADAYARLYFRVRVLWDVAQRPVSTHLFFSSTSSASRDVLFLRRQSRTHPQWNLDLMRMSSAKSQKYI